MNRTEKDLQKEIDLLETQIIEATVFAKFWDMTGDLSGNRKSQDNKNMDS